MQQATGAADAGEASATLDQPETAVPPEQAVPDAQPTANLSSPGPDEQPASQQVAVARPTPQLTARPQLADALGAAAKLAADANAAAEALENLRKLLERRLPADALPSPPVQQVLGSAREILAEAVLVPRSSPPPLPLYALPEPEAGSPQAKPVTPPPPPVPIERRRFDVRGFLAGFALSWAIGAALYVYLTAAG
jgi:hypothetical protein